MENGRRVVTLRANPRPQPFFLGVAHDDSAIGSTSVPFTAEERFPFNDLRSRPRSKPFCEPANVVKASDGPGGAVTGCDDKSAGCEPLVYRVGGIQCLPLFLGRQEP
jgi:hypothetical protein